MNTDDLDNFEHDVAHLTEQLKVAFQSKKASYTIHEHSDTLYIQIDGLENFTDIDIEVIANPILNSIDLDFEEIIISPIF